MHRHRRGGGAGTGRGGRGGHRDAPNLRGEEGGSAEGEEEGERADESHGRAGEETPRHTRRAREGSPDWHCQSPKLMPQARAVRTTS
jgi:hypothetical protein